MHATTFLPHLHTLSHALKNVKGSSNDYVLALALALQQ
jgi:hypothetical protein